MIKVIGIGSCESAINLLVRKNIDGVEYISTNICVEALSASMAATKILMGYRFCRGGYSNNQDLVRKAALDAVPKIKDALSTADITIYLINMMHGTGAAPVIVKEARKQGAIAIGVVALSFFSRGSWLVPEVDEVYQEILPYLDCFLILSPNLLELSMRKDDMFLQKRHGILEVCSQLDALVAAVAHYIIKMCPEGGQALSSHRTIAMGFGCAAGQRRATEATSNALVSPLLAGNNIENAQGAFVLISGTGISASEVKVICELVSGKLSRGANLRTEIVADDSFGEELKVMAIFTGLKDLQGNCVNEAYYDFDNKQQHMDDEITHADTWFDIFGGEDPGLKTWFVDFLDKVITIDAVPETINFPILRGLVTILKGFVRRGCRERDVAAIFLHLLSCSAAGNQFSVMAKGAIAKAYQELHMEKNLVELVEKRMRSSINKSRSAEDKLAVRSLLSEVVGV